MKKINYILVLFTFTCILISCKEYRRNPGKIYAPDMTYSRAFDYYNSTKEINEAGASFNKLPVKGTVAREQGAPDHITEADSTGSYGRSFPTDLTNKDVTEGSRLYLIYCGICHGQNMDGNGPLYNGGNGPYAAMPANLKDAKYTNFTPGKIYHAIMFGKNMMGSYAAQLDTKQRWQVVAYIKKVQGESGGNSYGMTTNVATAAESVKTASEVVKTAGEAVKTETEVKAVEKIEAKTEKKH
jgi:mono/diheme cytochrome c family protein